MVSKDTGSDQMGGDHVNRTAQLAGIPFKQHE